MPILIALGNNSISHHYLRMERRPCCGVPESTPKLETWAAEE